jgi:hypothetical protein
MFSESQFERAAADFFEKNPRHAEKYLSPDLVATLAAAMMRSRAPYPTAANAEMTFSALVASGELVRTDGKDESDDAAADEEYLKNVADRTMEEIRRAPLTRAECEGFASLPFAEVQRRYWAYDRVNEFRVRYDKAARAWGFQIPAPPSTTPVGTSEDVRSRL